MQDRPGIAPSSNRPILSADEPPPVAVHNGTGASRVLLLGDHAGRAIPRALGNLGLDEADRSRHIGWDIGIRALGARLADALDAVFIHQVYSRLVIDCNRAPRSPQSVVAISDGTPVPGNHNLSAEDIAARVDEVHAPYHAAIAAELARRRERAEPTILISLHSFTPVMGGRARPWEVGLLHDRGDTSFTTFALHSLQAVENLCVGDNEPYRMDGTDYTVPFHAYPARIPYAEFELRQDLLSNEGEIGRWTRIIGKIAAAAQ